MSARIGYMPMEGLKFSASIVNFYDKDPSGRGPAGNRQGFKKNNTALDLAVSYRPTFFSRLNLWAQYIHGWDVDHMEDLDSDAITIGASFDLTERWSLFAQGDHLRTKDLYRNNSFNDTAWAFYGGIKFFLPNGVNFEAGWKHEQITWETRGNKVAEGRGDTVYAHLGLDF